MIILLHRKKVQNPLLHLRCSRFHQDVNRNLEVSSSSSLEVFCPQQRFSQAFAGMRGGCREYRNWYSLERRISSGITTFAELASN